MLDKSIVLQSKQLLLRPLQDEDLHSMYALCREPDMWYYFTADLSDKSELKRWIADGINDPGRLAFAIVRKADQKVMGSTSIGNLSERDARAEIGWTWLAKTYRGRGYNTEAKWLLLRYLFDTCGMQRVEAKTDVLNTPARKGLQKAGFAEEGILRSHTLMTGGRRRDTIYYSMLRQEWLQKNPSIPDK